MQCGTRSAPWSEIFRVNGGCAVRYQCIPELLFSHSEVIYHEAIYLEVIYLQVIYLEVTFLEFTFLTSQIRLQPESGVKLSNVI